MKAKTFLNEIRILSAKIDASRDELEQLEAIATKTTSTFGDDRVQSSTSQDKMADCVVKIVDMKAKLKIDVMKMLEKRDFALQLMNQYCESNCIRLLHKRYLQSKSWEVIAVEMCFTYQYVSGKLHRKALAQLQKGLDEVYDDETALQHEKSVDHADKGTA